MKSPVSTILPLLLVSVIAAGCTLQPVTPPDQISQPEQSLAQASLCCESFAELAFKKLPPKFEARLKLDKADPVVNFSTGRSYVEPILLPENPGSILLQIDTLVSRKSLRKPWTAFYPVVTLLDDQYRAIATLDKLPFQYHSTLGLWRKLRIVVTIDDRYPKPTYALIHTSDERLNQSLSVQKDPTIIQRSGFDTMVYAQPTRSRDRILFSETGVIHVIAYPLIAG